MSKDISGFTIVELLVVIVVLSILASITVFSVKGITTRANNSARFNEAATVTKLLELYKVEKGDYPGIYDVNRTGGATASFCVGTNFIDDICNGGTWAGDTRFTNLLALVGKVPDKHFPAPNRDVGTSIEMYGGGYGFSLKTVVEGTSAADCPKQIPELYYRYPSTDILICGRYYAYGGQFGA